MFGDVITYPEIDMSRTYYIYKNKFNKEALLVQDFINRVNHKYFLGKLYGEDASSTHV